MEQYPEIIREYRLSSETLVEQLGIIWMKIYQHNISKANIWNDKTTSLRDKLEEHFKYLIHYAENIDSIEDGTYNGNLKVLKKSIDSLYSRNIDNETREKLDEILSIIDSKSYNNTEIAENIEGNIKEVDTIVQN